MFAMVKSLWTIPATYTRPFRRMLPRNLGGWDDDIWKLGDLLEYLSSFSSFVSRPGPLTRFNIHAEVKKYSEVTFMWDMEMF